DRKRDPTRLLSEDAMLDTARDLMVSLSALVASILAFLGLDAWRRQLRWTTEYQIALKTLKAIYALRESITEARGRFEAAPLPGEGHNGNSAESEVHRAARSYRLRLTRVGEDRKSTRLNSSHEWISYAVFCL